MDCIEHSRCRLCFSKNIEQVLDFGETPPANNYLSDPTQLEINYPLKVVLCKDCGSFQLKNTVAPEILFANYLYESSTSASFRKHFVDYAATLVNKFNLQPNDVVIDIGSNDGILLKPLKELGIRAVGVEPAKNLADQCNAEGLEVYNYFFNPQSAMKMNNVPAAKIITANNVFAHADDLHSIIEAVELMLRGDGVFVFEVQYLGDLYAKTLFDLVYHEHIFCHAVKPLKKLLMLHGLDLFEVQKVPTHGGSIRCFAKRARWQYPNWGSVADILAEEAAVGLDKPETWREFSRKLDKNKEALRALLIKAHEEGRLVCAYSYPAKATTLCSYYDIGDWFSFVIEDAKLKQGLYTPKFNVEIVDKSRLEGVDYAVILAWNFAEQIMANNPDFKGKWVVPLPELKIYD